MGKIVIGILCIVLLVGFSGAITNGIHDWRIDEVTQTFSVTTGSENTTANIVLSRDLFGDSVSEVESIASTIAENPATGTYTAGTNTLNVTGLTGSQTRTLTIVYNSEKEDTIMQTLGPFLTVLIFGGILGAIIYNVVGKKKTR